MDLENLLEALRITGELNSGYHERELVRALLSRLTGTAVDDSVVVFPAFYADLGRNIFFVKNVFDNAGCTFRDQGGIFIGDACLSGHNVVLATLDHGLAPGQG